MTAATAGPMQALPTPSPYHPGEVKVQDRVGSRDSSDRIGPFLRKYLNDQAKEFFNELTLLFVGQRLVTQCAPLVMKVCLNLSCCYSEDQATRPSLLQRGIAFIPAVVLSVQGPRWQHMGYDPQRHAWLH